jgi:GrpB-like predicted nucleotidyltransferase (UPF0157 family)
VLFLEPEAYQAEAQKLFALIADRLRASLPGAIVEHIGSSAIVGAISKGDLDIFVGVPRANFSDAIAAITALGFNIKENTAPPGYHNKP